MRRLEACQVDDTTAQITLRVQSTQTRAPCPLCATPARRIHSDYGRTLAELPWAQYRVCLQLRVRKWFCGNRACPRRIFTERLPTVAAPWARRTLRYAQRLSALGMALGGKAGVQLGHAWDVTVSRNTLLRLLRRQPAPSFPTPGCSEWTTSPCGSARPTARSWSTSSVGSRWPCSRSAPLSRWPSGSRRTQGWR